MSPKDAEEEGTEIEFNEEANLTGSMVESSKQKKLEKFDFVTEEGEHIYLTADQIKEQKRLKEIAKAEMDKKQEEVVKEELIDLLGFDVVTGPITLKVYREDGTDEVIPDFKASDLHLSEWRELNDLARKKRKHVDDIHYYFRSTKKFKSSVRYEYHPAGIVLNEPCLGMILFNPVQRQDFFTLEDFKDFNNEMLYTMHEIIFRLHQGPAIDDHARTFSSFLLAKVDKRNMNPLKQMRAIEQLS
ncbi:hypothetical protein Tco_0525671 [Tanacetum coccineum]